MAHPIPIKSQRFLHRMLCLFCGLVVIAALATSGLFGDLGQPDQLHQLLGLIGAVVVILSHSLASFYLIETSINIKRAVRQRALDESFVDRHKPIKSRVFPLAFWSMVTIGAAAVIGGAVDSGAFPMWVHLVLGIGAVTMSLIAWGAEDWALRETRAIIKEMNARIQSLPKAAAPEAEDDDPSPSDVGEREALWLLGRWLLFIGLSVWLLYGYLILNLHEHVSVLPFAVVSVMMCLVGWLLLARFKYRGQTPAGSTSE